MEGRNHIVTNFALFIFILEHWQNINVRLGDSCFQGKKNQIHPKANLHFEHSVLAAPLPQGTQQTRGKVQKWQWLEAWEEGLQCEEKWGLLELINAQGCLDNPFPCAISQVLLQGSMIFKGNKIPTDKMKYFLKGCN